MMRDELLRHLIALPPEADIVMEIGKVHIEIAGLVYRGDRANTTLLPHLADLRDALVEWGIPAGKTTELIAGKYVSTVARDNSGLRIPR
jgi:hypothetical protein